MPRGRRYDAVRTSLLNLHGADNVSIPKVAITMDDLLAIRRQLDTRYCEHARDWCACLIAFFGLLRIGEYMDAGLRVRLVRPEAASLEITVLYSKTCRSPAQVSVSARSDQLCPLRAFLHYRGFLARLGLATGPDSALFVFRFDTRQHSPMTGQQFIQLVRCHLAAAFPDRNVTGYAGHSFRRGGASALILAGVHADLVKSPRSLVVRHLLALFRRGAQPRHCAWPPLTRSPARPCSASAPAPAGASTSPAATSSFFFSTAALSSVSLSLFSSHWPHLDEWFSIGAPPILLIRIKVCGGRLRFSQHEMCMSVSL